MPTYTIKNNEDGEHFDTVCTYDELQVFLDEHPAFTKVITAPHIVSGIAGKTYKVRGNWSKITLAEKLDRILGNRKIL